MRRRVNWIGLALVLIAGPAMAQEQILWQADIAQAITQAKEEKKLVLVHFFGDSCAPCKVVDQKVFPQPKVVAAVMRNYVPVRINVEKDSKVAARYGIRSIPTDVFLSPAGQEFHRAQSTPSPLDYVSLLDQLVIQTGVGAARQSSLYDREAQNDPQQTVAAQQPPAQQQLVQNQYAPQNGSGGNRYPQGAAGTGQPQVPGTPPAEALVAGNSFAGSSQSPPQNGPYGSQPEPPPAQSTTIPGYAQPGGSGGQPSAAAMQRAAFQDPGDITARQEIRNQFVAVKDAPPIGFGGFCLVSVSPPVPGKKGVWKKGDRRFGAVHRGRTYLFASAAEQATFLADPDAYSPVLSGADPVIFADQGELVEGKWTIGLVVPVGQNRSELYLFDSEENLERFKANQKQYSVAAHQAMLRSETDRKYR